MHYQIINIFKSKRILLKSYPHLRSAEKKIKKSYSKLNTKIIQMPDKEDITIGFVLKNEAGNYGEIVDETENFWIVRRYKDNKEFEVLKSNFLDKFIDETFIYGGAI